MEDLPTIFGDELRIRHALSNIIEWIVGSVDHTREVIIGAGVEDNSLWISVESRQLPSNGMTETAQQDHLNIQAEKTSKGLAIFIAKHIIETHGGKLVMNETLENDLCCRILLPLSMEKTSKGTILITEDNPHTGLLLEFALEQEGFTPIRATNGSDALNILDETKVDLIILDAILPGMDGFELCQRVRSSPETATIPIVMASAMAKEENHAKALGLGANAYFQKPLSLSKLIPVVEKLIEEYKEVYQAET